MNLLLQHPKASVQHRLAGYALDVALLLSTCFIGWLVWSLVIWDQGLTPGKQILKMRVVSSQTGQPVTWGHMAIRQFLIPLTLQLPFSLISAAFDAGSYDYTYGSSFTAASAFVSLLGFVVFLLDAFWILNKGQNRRITDLWAKTDVVNTAAVLPQPTQPMYYPQP